jgi:hypothetical protein
MQAQRRRCPVAGDPMPFFRDRNLLFVHIPKNAGRSIEAALLGPTGSPDGGRRSWPNRLATGAQRRTAAVGVRERLIGTLDVTVAAQHLTFAEIELLGVLPAGQLAHCRRFCVCRNPFDRAVSSVFHFGGNPLDQSEFERALDRWLDRPPRDHNELAHRRTQAAYVRDSRGQPAVPHVLRFERLCDDFDAVDGRVRHRWCFAPLARQVPTRQEPSRLLQRVGKARGGACIRRRPRPVRLCLLTMLRTGP